MTVEFDAEAGWRLDPRVAVRPEPFGALLYHFGTRKLSFLKNLAMVNVVRELEHAATASAALATVGVPEAESDRYHEALAALARSAMIVRTPSQETEQR